MLHKCFGKKNSKWEPNCNTVFLYVQLSFWISVRCFYFAHLPHIYCRYIDDIRVYTRHRQELGDLKQALQSESRLRFTLEFGENTKLRFLDILLELEGASFKTTVLRKPTGARTCLNGNSECTEMYKKQLSDFM